MISKESASRTRILAVDDNDLIHMTLRLQLAPPEYELHCVDSAQAAIKRLHQDEFDAAILDIAMPELTGIELLKLIRQRHPKLPVVMLTGNTDRRSIVDSMKAGASDYVVKGDPDMEDELKFRLAQAIEKQRLLCRNEKLSNKLVDQLKRYEMIGHSRLMLKLKSQIAALKGHSSTVLLCGESGTGKELVARALNHQEQGGISRPFVAVNCGAIPSELAESELFGHEKGAFTGALQKQDGKFVSADGGDLFLDEIAELPLPLQAKILRVLQEQEVTPLGSNKSIPIRVRIIAASHQNLQSAVKAGKFREDLYYRLAVICLDVPPLRQRREDIPALVDHFLGQHGSKRLKITAKALDLLQSKSWPGNIRALSNCLERACIQAGMRDAKFITEDDLIFEDTKLAVETSAQVPADLIPQNESEVSQEHLDQFKQWAEKIYFEKAFELFQRNKSKLATHFKFSRDYVHRRLKLLGVGDANSEWSSQ